MNTTNRVTRLHRARREVSRTEGGPHKRPPSLLSLARVVAEQSRRRAHYLPGARFEDPQWLMTLDLFIAAEENRKVSVSSLCFASGVPATTALRHMRFLQAQGIFERVSHPSDRRISHVRLAEAARRQLARYLQSIRSSGLIGTDCPPVRATY